MNILNKITNGRSHAGEALLKVAEKMTLSEFRSYTEQRGLLTPGETLPATITIQTNLDYFRNWKLLIEDGRVHSIVGSSQPHEILNAMIDEVRGEWLARNEEAGARQQQAARPQ